MDAERRRAEIELFGGTWHAPGHHSVAFTLTRYGGLFEDGSNEAVDRLDAHLQAFQGRTPVSELRRG